MPTLHTSEKTKSGLLHKLPTVEYLPVDSPWMDTRTAARYIGVSARTIQRWIPRGLPAHRVGAVVRFHRDELDAWIRKQENPARLKARVAMTSRRGRR